MNWQHPYLVSSGTAALLQKRQNIELANCGKLIHSALFVRRRHELGMHQVVFAAVGTVGFFAEHISQLHYRSVFGYRTFFFLFF